MSFENYKRLHEEQLKNQQFLNEQLQKLRSQQVKNPESDFYHDLNEAADNILKILSELIDANTLFMASNDSIANTIFKAINKKEVLVEEGTVLPFEQTYCSLVTKYSTNRALVIHDTKSDPLTAGLEVTSKLASCSFVGVPIKLKNGQVFGTICAMDSRKYKFTSKDITILNSMASFFGYVLELEKTIEELQLANKA